MSDYGMLAPAIAQLESWTLEDAIHAYSEWAATGGDTDAALASPLIQWQSWHQDLPRFHQRYEQGDSAALLKAVERCALVGLPLPTWCRQAYVKSWRKASHYECRTLDEAFDYDDLKGINLARARERFLNSVHVVSEVKRMIHAGITVEKAFQLAAERHGVSFSRARDWYYELRYDPSTARFLPEK
ncbi:hypothetical protein [Halomonas ramblicola]|uniref:hypothetical protein n=1 Tax=Halomonas ramblicola TaxID=747349 RepID=UPI0025B476E7|nr:hypothetical protein [Halomonas ramblicola]MDN3523526.1 hypothetical protein [Halomonas ramblicola]